MNYNDIVLVTYNQGGDKDYNYLMTIEDYKRHTTEIVDPNLADKRELFDEALELGLSKYDLSTCSHVFWGMGEVLSARICQSEAMLRDFINGHYSDETTVPVFDEGMCSKECLDFAEKVLSKERPSYDYNSMESARLDRGETFLVIFNRKGVYEANYAMNQADFVDYLSNELDYSSEEVLDMGIKLGSTKYDESFADIYWYAANQTVYAKVCSSEEQLIDFFRGKYNDEGIEYWEIDKEMCSKECISLFEKMSKKKDMPRR